MTTEEFWLDDLVVGTRRKQDEEEPYASEGLYQQLVSPDHRTGVCRTVKERKVLFTSEDLPYPLSR